MRRVHLRRDDDIFITENNYALLNKDYVLNKDYLLEPVQNNYRRSNMLEQATDMTDQAYGLLTLIPETDNYYKYIKQIAGQDSESKEKLRNLNDTRPNGPSPRSARELLKGYYDISRPMNQDVSKFVESNINQLKAIENSARERVR